MTYDENYVNCLYAQLDSQLSKIVHYEEIIEEQNFMIDNLEREQEELRKQNTSYYNEIKKLRRMIIEYENKELFNDVRQTKFQKKKS